MLYDMVAVRDLSPAELVRMARRRAGLTQQQLARRTGTTQTAIARLERHDANPRVSTLRRAIEASGGRLVLQVEVPPKDGDADLDLVQLREHMRRSAAERAAAHDRAYAEIAAMVHAARRSR